MLHFGFLRRSIGAALAILALGGQLDPIPPWP
jgi:hypothetical protein